jgi:hypothetical protein
VADPADADLAVLRLGTPYEPRPGRFEAFSRTGRLDFPGQRLEEILTLLDTVPTVVTVHLELPAVIPEIARCSGSGIECPGLDGRRVDRCGARAGGADRNRELDPPSTRASTPIPQVPSQPRRPPPRPKSGSGFKARRQNERFPREIDEFQLDVSEAPALLRASQSAVVPTRYVGVPGRSGVVEDMCSDEVGPGGRFVPVNREGVVGAEMVSGGIRPKTAGNGFGQSCSARVGNGRGDGQYAVFGEVGCVAVPVPVVEGTGEIDAGR